MNPIGRQFPVENRTWIQSRFARPDTFSGLAGHPNFDWPNPRGYEFPVALRSWSNSLNTTTLIPPVPGPLGVLFFQTDWPVPKGPTVIQDVLGFVNVPTQSALVAPTFIKYQSDWPVPKAPQYPQSLREYSQNLLQWTLKPDIVFVPSIAVILTDRDNVPIPGLTGLHYAWFDQPSVQSEVTPVIKGSGGSTDSTGLFSLQTLTGSALTVGQVGRLQVSDSDGTITQSPVSKVADGPIQVS